MTDHKAQGKANKAKGARFELKVRQKLEDDGWNVTKFRCNVYLPTSSIVQAKNKFIPGRGMMLGSGFPDFLAFRIIRGTEQIMFVECKFNGKLTAEEKRKLDCLVKMGFTCFVAQDENKRVYFREFVEYRERDRIHRKETGD